MILTPVVHVSVHITSGSSRDNNFYYLWKIRDKWQNNMLDSNDHPGRCLGTSPAPAGSERDRLKTMNYESNDTPLSCQKDDFWALMEDE